MSTKRFLPSCTDNFHFRVQKWTTRKMLCWHPCMCITRARPKSCRRGSRHTNNCKKVEKKRWPLIRKIAFYICILCVLFKLIILGNDSGHSVPNTIELQDCPVPPKKAATSNNAIRPPEEDKTQTSRKKMYNISVGIRCYAQRIFITCVCVCVCRQTTRKCFMSWWL